jgi:hypothetical protein
MDNNYYLRNYIIINVLSDSKLMRKKSSKLKNIQLIPSKKGSLLTKKGSLLMAKTKKKGNVVWYLALVAFFITIWVIGYFSR